MKTKRKKPATISEASILMWQHLGEICRQHGPWADREYKFHPERKWKFDFVITDPSFTSNPAQLRIAIEIEGGVFGYRDPKRGYVRGGAHSSISGILRDLEKYNEAAALGWRVLRFLPSQVLDGTAIAFIRRVLES